MRKHFIVLFIISVICIIISMLLIFNAPKQVKQGKFSQVLNERDSKYGETIDDVEGYAFLGELIGGATIDLASGLVAMLFILIIPGFLSFLIGICLLISVLVQLGQEKKWKDTTSKVFTAISLAFVSILCIILLTDCLIGFGLNKIYLFLVLLLNIICLAMHIKTIVKTNSLKNVKKNK